MPQCSLAKEMHVETDSVEGGWQKELRGRWWAASSANASLRVPFECTEDGCGLIVGMTISYQPLGTVDVYVDGQLVRHALSNAELSWALARSPKWTINRFHTVVAPVGEGSGSGLAAGRHLLTVVCRGETLPEIAHLPTNYSRHEVHVRGVVVIYTPM